jgi:dTDP-4-amino-4,6-dideoxygalactose transaminase
MLKCESGALHNDPVFVSIPLVPEKEKLQVVMAELLENKWITNYGKYHKLLETGLSRYLGEGGVSLVSNGTLGLMLALKALCPPGSEVITTPFTFVATVNAIEWCGMRPVFCDIEPDHFTIDPNKLNELITPNTSAILPVHVYGYPCKIDDIAEIAEANNLRVIYDAAHTFSVKYRGVPLARAGDVSVLSFHATKLFNTIEGGAVLSNDESVLNRINRLRNFGITGETTIEDVGINAKMNEVSALWGWLLLDKVEAEVAHRRKVDRMYRDGLSQLTSIYIPNIPDTLQWNYSYFPVVFEEKQGLSRDTVYDALRLENVYARKYFYPTINSLSIYSDSAQHSTPTAESISDRVLCLPIHSGVSEAVVNKIVDTIVKHY